MGMVGSTVVVVVNKEDPRELNETCCQSIGGMMGKSRGQPNGPPPTFRLVFFEKATCLRISQVIV